MATTTVLGATGMTGSYILSTLLSLPSTTVSSVTTISRRPPNTSIPTSSTPPAFTQHVDSDTSKYAAFLTSPTPPQILFSALATTRSAAGGFDAQYALEHDLNLALAEAARKHPTSPTHTYVLISASGANSNSMIPYSKMKGELEQNLIALDFPCLILLRPGLIGGRRTESRPAEAAIRWLADGLGAVSGGKLKDFWTQDADVIARAACRIGLKAKNGELKDKVTILGQSEIMELGRAKLTEEEMKGK